MTRVAPINGKRALATIGAAMVAAVVMLVVGQIVGTSIARGMREREVRAAIDAGLEDDCRDVFAQYANHPRFLKSGYLRLFPDSPGFQALPLSIRKLQPCYVTIEDHRSGWGLPANIGLCKNGFGGFASGVRVFLTRADIRKPFWSKPLTSTTYLWEEET